MAKEWLEKMPHILISQSYIFVHAGYDGRVVEQNEDFVLWSRENFGIIILPVRKSIMDIRQV